MKNLKALTDAEALVAGLGVFARSRDLQKFPPKPDETLAQLGIGPSNLDGPVRAWINAKFRRPRGWPLFASGDLTVDLTWSDLKKKVLTHEEKPAELLKAAPLKEAGKRSTRATAKSKLLGKAGAK